MLRIYVFARAGHGGATGVGGSRRKDRGAVMEEAATGSEPLHSPYPCHSVSTEIISNQYPE